MSKKNNVNPDHYKLDGRDRKNEDILHAQNKQTYSESKASGGNANFIPGNEPTDKHDDPDDVESPSSQLGQRGGVEQADEASRSRGTD